MNPQTELIEGVHETFLELMYESMDSSYSKEEKESLRAQMKEARRRQKTLVKLTFDQNTEGYQEANTEMKKVLAELKKDMDRLEDMVKFMGNLKKMFAAIDKIIKAASKAF